MHILSIMNYIEKSFHAVCEAIESLSRKADNIFLPIKPTYAYDFIMTQTNTLLKVKVIQTSAQAPKGGYVANLRKSGGYMNSKEHKAPFNPSSCDILFIVSPEGKYVIPSEKITQKRAINLSKFEQYKMRPMAP